MDEYRIVLNENDEEISLIKLSEINPPDSEITYRILWVGFVAKIKAFSMLVKGENSDAITEQILLDCVNDYEGKVSAGIGIKFANSLAAFLSQNGVDGFDRNATVSPADLAAAFVVLNGDSKGDFFVTFTHEVWEENDGSTRSISFSKTD